jgi:hypothetical protein
MEVGPPHSKRIGAVDRSFNFFLEISRQIKKRQIIAAPEGLMR